MAADDLATQEPTYLTDSVISTMAAGYLVIQEFKALAAMILT